MERVKNIKSRASAWISGRRMGSMESLNIRSMPGAPLDPPCPDGKTEVELTCIKIRQHLEKKKYQRVVEMLRELPYDFILKCLEGFPFKALNRAVPDTFPIWETLLTKLHTTEEGYIPQFPYAACDELVLQIARLLEVCEGRWRKEGRRGECGERQVGEGEGGEGREVEVGGRNGALGKEGGGLARNRSSSGHSHPPHEFEQLAQDCKRVLKRVYMQYNEVLEQLYKQHECVQHALYTLSLHMPLGTDPNAVSLQQTIMEEVHASLEDYNDALERLQDLSQAEVLTMSEALLDSRANGINNHGASNGVSKGNGEATGTGSGVGGYFPTPPTPNQIQLQERLYFNQCILTALKPSRRLDNLHQLMEILNERICGDKEVLAIFGSIRQRDTRTKDTEPVEPCLRRHLYSIECAISVLKEIEKDLEITLPREPESPGSTSAEECYPLVTTQPDSAEEDILTGRRHSAALVDDGVWDELEMGVRDNHIRLSLPPSHRRPRSASPQKALRIYPGLMSGSSESSGDSTTNLVSRASVSVHDLHSAQSQPASTAFPRAQSLKASHSRAVVAGKKKSMFAFFPISLTNLSTSSGNVSGKRSKKLFRTGSGGLIDKPTIEGMSTNEFMLQQELEYSNKELLQAREMIHEMRKRERELTDRLSEQAQRHLQDSEKFEDILLGASRPTMVVQRYQELYSQGRVEALDAIEALQQHLGVELEVQSALAGATSATMRGRGVGEVCSLSTQLLLDVLKCAYTAASAALTKLSEDWKHALAVNTVQDTVAVKQLESAVSVYLRRVCAKHDTTGIVAETNALISQSYCKFPVFGQIQQLEPFNSYIQECAKVAWDLCVQTPPMVLNYSQTEFNFDLHTRFFSADKCSSDIIVYLWPTLLQSSSGSILFRGVVVT